MASGHLPRRRAGFGCTSSLGGETPLTRIFALLGPTAAGKSEIALQIAEERDAPIISVDSMQVYRGMDIGTAKPTPADQERVRHYMINLVEPESEFSVAEFQRQARSVIDSRNHPEVFVVGGSGLHFRALVDPHTFPPHDPHVRAEIEQLQDPASALVGVDPGAGQVLDLANRRRVVRALEVHQLTGLTPTIRAASSEAESLRSYQPLYSFRAVGVDPGIELEPRVAARVEAMMGAGFLYEVERLEERLGKTARKAVGYREILEHLAGRAEIDETWDRVSRSTIGLARRQRTFFRRDPRIEWIEWSSSLDQRISSVSRAWGLS